MITADKIELRLSELTTVPMVVPQWETDLLRATHGHDDVKVVGQEMIDRDAPDPVDEFARLEGRYKARDEDGGRVSAVFEVYGKQRAGVQALTRAIKAATVKKPEAA